MTNPSPKSVLKRYPAGSIFQGFGENKSDYAPIGYTNGHPGWDILAYQGAPIVACADGIVQDVALDPTRLGGISCWIKTLDGKILHSYGHLQRLFVVKGQIVEEGEQIGEMGNTGFVISGGTKYWGNAPAGKGVHLHLNIVPLLPNGEKEFPNNGTGGAVDPTPYFAESIKPEIPDPRVPLLQTIVELYRSILRKLGQEPNV